MPGGARAVAGRGAGLKQPVGAAAELIHLRALCVFKPDGSHRPLGLPEADVRFFLGCIAAQEKPGWAKFYTSPLPEAAAAQAREVERARDCLAQAKAAESQAVSDGSLDDCVAAREQEDAALEAIARAATQGRAPELSGVYHLDGETLEVCTARDGATRAAGWAARALGVRRGRPSRWVGQPCMRTHVHALVPGRSYSPGGRALHAGR